MNMRQDLAQNRLQLRQKLLKRSVRQHMLDNITQKRVDLLHVKRNNKGKTTSRRPKYLHGYSIQMSATLIYSAGSSSFITSFQTYDK
jgi:hypothetical protein